MSDQTRDSWINQKLDSLEARILKLEGNNASIIEAEPRWIPSEPTWCWVWAGYAFDADDTFKRLVIGFEAGFYITLSSVNGSFTAKGAFTSAKPCEGRDIPKEWTELAKSTK